MTDYPNCSIDYFTNKNLSVSPNSHFRLHLTCKSTNQYFLVCDEWRELILSAAFTGEQGEGDGVDAVLLGGAGALGVGDVHLELHRLLENRRTGCGLVLRSETGLRDDAVAQTGDLRGREVSRNTDKQPGSERKRQQRRRTRVLDLSHLNVSRRPAASASDSTPTAKREQTAVCCTWCCCPTVTWSPADVTKLDIM